MSITEKQEFKKSIKLKSHKQNSVLNTGNWFKIKVDKTGIYKLSYNDLINVGISDPKNVRIYGNGGSMLPIKNVDFRYDDLVENPIFMEKGNDGVFNQDDYILFYARGPVDWKYKEQEQIFSQSLNMYSDYAYYFITSDLGYGKKITPENSPSASITNNVNSYDDYAFCEKNDTNLVRSGSVWFGEAFINQTSYNFSFSFPNRVVSEPLKIKTHVASYSSNSYPDSYFKITSDNTDIQTIFVPGFNTGASAPPAATDKTATSFFSDSNQDLNINIKYFGTTSSSRGWLDYILLNVRQHLSMDENQINFRDINSVGAGNISQFTLSNATQSIKIWDVSNISNIKQIPTQLSGDELIFKVTTDTLREFIAFKGNEFPTPITQGDDVGKIENQNLHALNFYDLIIVSHPDFKSYADELADFHKNSDNLKVLSVTNSQVYNEFSSGSPDVSAIRDFIKMFYDRASTQEQIPKYLLLFGDGSYDNKTQSIENSNFILTFQSEESLSSYSFVTDDFYGMLDDDEGGSIGALDIGVGRLPVRTDDEAQAVTNKIKNYYNTENLGDWRNSICFIGDEEDSNNYMYQANELSKTISSDHPTYNIDKIFLDSYPQISTPSGQRYPDVTIAINNKMKKGALLVDYIGHGNPTKFTHEEVIKVNDVASWTNSNHLPLFMTATCEVSRFDDYARTSIGELILLNPNGGGIGLLSTTRMVSSGANYALNKNFINFVFNKDLRLGDIVRLTKVNTGSETSSNKRNFTLLGDPALKLNIPKHSVITSKINNNTITEKNDTLNALSKVTIQGFIQDETGNKLTDFNGLISPIIYDKPVSKTTLSNDGNIPFTYNLQKNIIYKGNASVTNGDFTFSFIVPKDISYNFGNGKISYYANNSNTDAAGFSNDI
ncbi:MAG: type IX secretion system sortase PorU, partial [Bacteroidales bacterium]|nr:type IX secretion system sortase PorU [Bacteroidales bacterium]